MIKEWIELYRPKNKKELNQAFREIMQEITLAGLYRSSFFEKGAFYGGTALRIFHGLDRFSEDLDFTLLDSHEDFSLANYLNAVENEFFSLGIKVSIKEKEKSTQTNIESAFLNVGACSIILTAFFLLIFSVISASVVNNKPVKNGFVK